MNIDEIQITPDFLLQAYTNGLFPMAESASDPQIFWIEPKQRGIIPLAEFHTPRRLIRTIRTQPFDIRIDHDFEAVISYCAAPIAGRRKTWINQPIRDLYTALFEMGHCHTVEAYREGKLVGGLYGIALKSVFFGESMFHKEKNASKITLIYLASRLREAGFTLLDTQFISQHLTQFGAVEIDKKTYRKKLEAALKIDADFNRPALHPSVESVLQFVSQTSNTGCSSA